jgi:hypothetical protein
MRKQLNRMKRQKDGESLGPRWLTVQAQTEWTASQDKDMEELIREAQNKGSRAAIVAYCNADKKNTNEKKQRLTHLTKAMDWSLYDSTI